MDPIPLGIDIRLLRRQRHWTQRRLADEARISPSAVSLVECGHADRLTIATVARIVAALGARLTVRIYWKGEGLDRLRDGRHASIVEAMIRRLQADGWDVRAEVSFSEFGERGSIDILAFHPATGALLVIEVKSVVPDLQAMLANLDRKARLARGIAKGLGWEARTVSRLLVLPDDRTTRRRVDTHEATFAVALPARTVAVKRWLAAPDDALAGILFLSDTNHSRRRRPRVAGLATADAQAVAQDRPEPPDSGQIPM